MTVKLKENGKWYCNFMLHGVRIHRLCAGAKTKEQAEIIETALKFKLMQQQHGIIPKESKKVKLSSIIKLYDNYGKINKLSYGRDSFGKYIGIFFNKNTYINEISAEKIEEFKVWLKTERKSSNSTINKYLSALSKMFNLAIDNGLYNQNPVRQIKKFREDNHKVRYLTVEEENRLFSSINQLYPYLRPIVICALQTGMRKGEILNLKWSNIDFDFNFIELLKTKSGKSRRIPISDSLMSVFNSLPKNNEYIFVNPKTNQPYTDIKKSFHTVLKNANIQNFRFHDLRHTVATRMAEKVAIPIVQDILGHSKVSTTMRYAHVIPEIKREAINILNSYS